MLLLPAMEPHGEGRIVMTSSVMGIISSPGRGASAASKYALEAWADALRMELRQANAGSGRDQHDYTGHDISSFVTASIGRATVFIRSVILTSPT